MMKSKQERDFDKRVKDAEFLKQLEGVSYRMGYLLTKDVPICEQKRYELESNMAWELGIEPDCELAELIAFIIEYYKKKQNELL
jgi:hypothetical protein